MAEVQPADPGARRAALLWLGVAFVAGAILLWFLETSRPAVAAWLKEDPAQTATRARMLLGGLAIVTAGPAVGIGVWLLRLGARVMAAGRFPPPGLRMVQDTVVVAGDAARRRGRIAQGFGLALVGAGLTMAMLLWRLAP